jgi:hypothetical protein
VKNPAEVAAVTILLPPSPPSSCTCFDDVYGNNNDNDNDYGDDNGADGRGSVIIEN